MTLEVYSDYGSGGSMNSSTSWGSQDHVDWVSFQSHLRPIRKARPKSFSFLDTVVTGSCSVEDSMREFRLNGSDSPYEPEEDLWAYAGEWTGLGPANTYLRQKSWPEPDRSPARPLPPPTPAPAPAQAWPALAADEFDLTLSSAQGHDYTQSPVTSRFAPAQATPDFKPSPMDTDFTAPLNTLNFTFTPNTQNFLPLQTPTATDFNPMSQDFMMSTNGLHDFKTSTMGSQDFKPSTMGSQDFITSTMGSQDFKTSTMGSQDFLTSTMGSQDFKTSTVGIDDFNTFIMDSQDFKTATMDVQGFKVPTVGSQDFKTQTMDLQGFNIPTGGSQDFKTATMDLQGFKVPTVGSQDIKTATMDLQGFKVPTVGSQDFKTATMDLQGFNIPTGFSQDFKTSTMGSQHFKTSKMSPQDFKTSSLINQDFKFMAHAFQPPPAQPDVISEEQRRVLYSIPPETLYHVLQQLERREQIFDKRAKRYSDSHGCRFCKKNRERESFYRSHTLKDASGRVLCPVLRALVCPRCGACGDLAHTLKYCRLTTCEERMQAQAMMRSVRIASERRRDSRPHYIKFGETPPSVLHDTAAAFREIPLDPLWAALERKLMC